MKLHFPLRLFVFLTLISSCSEPVSTKTGMRPKGDSLRLAVRPFSGIKNTYVVEVSEALRNYYKASVTILDETSLPDHACSPYEKTRYRADTLLRFLTLNTDAKFDHVIGLTSSDISCTKNKEPKWKYRDWGVFGLGSCPGKACVVSVYRLGARGADEKTKMARLRKIACHEVGHTLGLPHCENSNCFMTDAAEKITTIDNAKEELCETCFKKINP